MTNKQKRDLMAYLWQNPEADDFNAAYIFGCSKTTVQNYKKAVGMATTVTDALANKQSPAEQE